jgi:lipopolysaccharide/colanic/teichoic acid biosynthesis glycosyltransferase
MKNQFSPLYATFLKRIIDFLLALLGLILLSPLLLVLIIILLFINRGKPFFVQERPGKGGKLFKIIKFKTMRDLDPRADRDVHSPDRVTKVGSFIRKYSLDELLQLVNVFKGDMSLVGPRPLLIEYLPLYNENQRKRHNVRPGITGWAQINGRNTLSWNEKFKFDTWYVDHVSFTLDIEILIKTVLKVFKKEGVNQGEEIIMPVWKGN